MDKQVKDMTGQRFGLWTVLSHAGTRQHTKSHPAMWKCRCDCGTEATIPGSELRKKRTPTRSCGCSKQGPQPERIGKYSREKHHAWKGGRSVDKKGYVLMSCSMVRDLYPNARWRDGRRERKMFEHQAVMSNHLKRPLHKDETIHHKNGDRSDNRLENLELRAGKHGPGQSIPDLVAWAKEILRRYDT